MGEDDSSGTNWVERIAEKVPAEVAGSVLVLIVFLWMSPSILDKMLNDTHVNWYLVFLGAVVFGQVFSTCLHAISKHNERKRRSLYKYEPTTLVSPSKTTVASKTEKEIEEAVESMKGSVQNAQT